MGKLPLGKLLLWKMYIWEVVAWEIAHLESCHLGKYPWEVAAWEKAFGKVPNIVPNMKDINLISNFKQNLIEDFYQQNKCFDSNTCSFCKRIKDFTTHKAYF